MGFVKNSSVDFIVPDFILDLLLLMCRIFSFFYRRLILHMLQLSFRIKLLLVWGRFGFYQGGTLKQAF